MDRTQAEILILAVIGILLVLLFGSPIRRKVDVEVTGDRVGSTTEREQENGVGMDVEAQPLRILKAVR